MAITRWQPDRTSPLPPWPVPTVGTALARGLLGRCPACGKAHLFNGFKWGATNGGSPTDEMAGVIAEQVVRPRGDRVRHAVSVYVVRVRRRARFGGARAKTRMGFVPDEVMTNIEVEITVVIQVGKCGGGGPVAITAQAGTLGDVFEGSVTTIAVQDIAPPSCEEQIAMAVVVDVGDRNAMAVTTGQAGDA